MCSLRAAQGIADGVRTYTGKDEYRFGDLTEATVQKVTGNDEYRFGDFTKGAIKSVTGKDDYRFGDITKSLFKRMRGGGAGSLPSAVAALSGAFAEDPVALSPR